MARLAELSATSNDEKSWRPVLLGRVPANALNFKENWRRYAVVVALLALGAAGALLMAGGNSSVNIQAFRKEFVAVGNDPVKLRAFILHCAAVSCPMEQEARDRLGKAEEAARRAQIVEAALDAAGIDLAQLRKFVQQCDATSCAVAQEAHDRLAKAEEVTHRTQIVEAALDAAGIDLAQLRKFVQQCDATSCAVAQEARTRLAKAEDAERARLARIAETERRTLDAAGTDLGQLRKFVQQCNSTCTVAQEARNRLAKAEDVERTRLAQIAETERRALDATGTDLGQLRKFVQQCNATSCTVAQEARNRLAKAEDAERARLAQIADTDGKALDAAGTDLGQLRKFIQQCNATSCTIAQEAHNRLAKAEDAEHLRLERIAELTKPKPVLGFKMTVGYDMNGGDINSPDYLIRETDAAKCLTKCQATNGCIAYSFDKWIKTCYLKDKLVSLTLDPRSDTSIRKDQSFPGLSNSPKHFCRYPSLAAIGEGPPGLSLPTAKACEQSCETDQTCAAYTFRTTDKLCRLLRNTVDRQKGIGFESNTSGVRTQILCN